MLKWEKLSEYSSDEMSVSRKFLILLVIGFLMVLVGVSILVVATIFSGGDLGFGVFILIGPVPIVLGAGSQGAWMVFFGIVITALSVIMFLLLRRKAKP